MHVCCVNRNDTMSDYSGKDLLNVFNDLNVNLLNLNPNVVKAWFDTDDKDMKNLLIWMCTSLSRKNYVSPLENAEFLELETPLVDEKYERELRNIEKQYPGLLDVDSNAFEIEFIQDEIDLLIEEEQQTDNLIKVNEILQSDLSKEFTYLTSKEIQISLKVKSAQEQCNSLGEKLDDMNSELHKRLKKYGSNLYNFEFSTIPNFINNMDIRTCQENFNGLVSYFIPILESEFLPTDSADLEIQDCLDTVNTNDSIFNSLTTMKSRIFNSHQQYLVTKIEGEKLKEILNYLNKFNVTTILSFPESGVTMNREAKEEMKKKMCEMLDNIFEKIADQHIAKTKFKYAQQELEINQSKLDRLEKIEAIIIQYMCHYVLLNMLLIQEKKDIDKSDQFFRKILHYVSKDLQSCASRTEKMKKIISDYGNYSSESIGEKYSLIRSIIKILSNEEDYSLSKALEVVSEFKNELHALESKLFSTDLHDFKDRTKNLKNDIKILQSFLVCGPTHRIVLIPPDLSCILREMDEHLKKQVDSVKSALDISSKMNTMVTNKWQNYRRQLWMYFYCDPQKLFFIIQEIEEEFKKRTIKNRQVW